jgi:peptidoglycan/LPS O-acetylase OafA/YrhL
MVLADEFSTQNAFLGTYYAYTLLMAMFRALCCVCYLGLFTSIALRWFNRPSPIQQHFAAISYRVYLTHIFVVCLVQFVFLRITNLSAYATFFGTLVVSFVGSYVVAIAVPRLAVWRWTDQSQQTSSNVDQGAVSEGLLSQLDGSTTRRLAEPAISIDPSDGLPAPEEA